MSPEDALQKNTWEFDNNFYIHNPESGDFYNIYTGLTSDGYFNFSNGDHLFLGGDLWLTDGTWVDSDPVSGSDVTINWYASDGSYLSTGVSYEIDNSSLISGVYVTVEYEGVNYGMSPSDALSKTILNTPAEFTGLGITGEFTEGSILTADYQITDANGWSGVADVSWYYADDLNTVVGTGDQYYLSASDVGRQMYFEVSFTDNDGFAESAQYTGAQYVQEAPPVNTPAEFTGLELLESLRKAQSLLRIIKLQMQMVGVVLQMCLGITLMT